MMTTAITVSDPSIALAELLLEVDNRNADMDAEDLRAARAAEHAALEAQVQKLHEAADDVRLGAWVQGALSLGGTAATFGADFLKPGSVATACKDTAPGLSALGPVARSLGDAARGDDEADAKRAEGRVIDARARAEEAEQHRQRMAQMSDRTLSAVGEIVAAEAQGNLALIANV